LRLALRGAAHLPGRELGARLFSPPPADQIELPDYAHLAVR
jgi:hypothetical protein